MPHALAQSDNFTLDEADARILATPSAYADERIHNLYRRLRAQNPLGRAILPGFDPFWVVTKHADIDFIGKHNQLFHYGDRFSILTDKKGVEAVQAVTGQPYILRALTSMDAPDHMKYRLLTQSWFMPANLRRIEERISATARNSINEMALLGGECDFAGDIALNYPLRVILEILGVPQRDFPMMLSLTQQIFAPADSEASANSDPSSDNFQDKFLKSLSEMSEYFTALAVDRRKSPKEDLATLLATSEINGKPLDSLDLMGYFVIIATAGHDTTSSSTAAAVRQLASDPQLFARIKGDRSLIPGLIEETIRWETPVKHFMRSAVDDIEIRGHQVRAHDWLMICYASANRDEEVFERPYEFLIDRKAGKNMAFGIGPHVCLGQHLAKTEMRVLLEELFTRVESLEMAGPSTTIASTFVNGPKSVPIRYHMI